MTHGIVEPTTPGNSRGCFPLALLQELTYSLVEAEGNECRRESSCPRERWIC
jgi:hypothetical protein